MIISAPWVPIFNPLNALHSPANYFNKSRVFASPDASQLPSPDDVFSTAIPTSTDAENSFLLTRGVSEGIMHLTFIDGHRVREHSGTNLFNSNAITVYGQQQPLSLLLLALNSEHPRDEPVSSSHRATPSETSNGSGSATPQTSFPVVKENIAALRLSGERIPCTPCEASLLSKTASVRMRALARWVAGYIYGAIICSGLPPTCSVESQERVSNRIYAVLESTTLPPPTVFTALWFIDRFPFALCATGGNGSRQALFRLLCDGGIEETIFRAFIAGAMLANKGNDDFNLTAVEWDLASRYNLKALNLLEITALKAFDWRVVINSAQWQNWMRCIEIYHLAQPLDPDYEKIACIINRVAYHDPHWDCVPHTAQSDLTDDWDFDECLDVSAASASQLPSPVSCCPTPHISLAPLPPYSSACNFQPELIVGRRPILSSRNVRIAVREPSPWFPAADPIVESAKPRRTIGTAPMMARVIFKPTTAASLVEDLLAGRLPPRFQALRQSRTSNNLPTWSPFAALMPQAVHTRVVP